MSDLSEEGLAEFEAYIAVAKQRIKASCEEALGDIYVGLSSWIESDSWMNFRGKVMDALMDYSKLNKWDAKRVREAVLKNHYDEVIKDLNQDLIDQVEDLKDRLDLLERRGKYAT